MKRLVQRKVDELFEMNRPTVMSATLFDRLTGEQKLERTRQLELTGHRSRLESLEAQLRVVQGQIAAMHGVVKLSENKVSAAQKQRASTERKVEAAFANSTLDLNCLSDHMKLYCLQLGGAITDLHSHHQTAVNDCFQVLLYVVSLLGTNTLTKANILVRWLHAELQVVRSSRHIRSSLKSRKMYTVMMLRSAPFEIRWCSLADVSAVLTNLVIT